MLNLLDVYSNRNNRLRGFYILAEASQYWSIPRADLTLRSPPPHTHPKNLLELFEVLFPWVELSIHLPRGGGTKGGYQGVGKGGKGGGQGVGG